MLRLLTGSLVLLSVALAEDEIRVERQDDAVIVRSPIAQGNFLFRAPPFFKEVEVEEAFAVHLSATRGKATAHIRLRLGQVTAGQARRGIDALVREKEAGYTAGGYGKLNVSGEGARRLAETAGKAGERRLVLVVVDGPRLYELFLDHAPPDTVLEGQLAAVATGFTILDPKGAPIAGAEPGDLKADTIEHEYYRLKVYKPAGFAQEEVDPERDKGIFLHLRKEDKYRNRCDIRIRVHLARTMKQTPAFKAQKAIERFVTKYQSAKAPKKPRRTGFAGAKNAWRFKMVGKTKTSSVVEEEWRVIEHENGRIYEIQLTTYGGAAREFKKDIRAFWKKLKISSK
ncbi:MAG: hypothetical protein ACYTG3_14215 [Planctomycetota bacterium]|jgi:hypothetical protein